MIQPTVEDNMGLFNSHYSNSHRFEDLWLWATVSFVNLSTTAGFTAETTALMPNSTVLV